MSALTKTLVKTVTETQKLDRIDLYDSKRADFLQEVIEGLEDGILILSQTGEIIHANASARRLCCQFNQGNFNQNFVPPVIWNFCESLFNSRYLFSDKLVILSDEIVLDKSNIFRIRVRLLDLEGFEVPCLLVTIENQYESVKNVALTEVKKFDLTPREAEIWLLYRSNYSYKEIATKLYITINTVKKHMKNIYTKRQANMSYD
ncbi:MAG: helix-turn-helix transcriptional regulator [Nostoc sp. CmiVER01]|uniref:helix-turn-helix transcriptional regulator n=1 Tax=Nostoc sp. CmiVER01 TaxID=3075384 RepID=UPI002AD52F4E|nr:MULTISPECIES: LuxR C-terminal-related transcriptional regulator [unclassified Nostoc]MDZ8127139.1 LuxR C-terminal-related transcriptional regulator [Nostoc sp. CmiVER01]MDZ8222422.1 LuxR C-terminal-related transcriptional regulator [Nostoc sp. ChiVER01]